MNKIQVSVLTEGHESPGGMMMFLARLTQRGHNIKDMDDLMAMYNKATIDDPIFSVNRKKLLKTVSKLPHGTITRFTPITIAIVGASRRFLAQARTHQVGMTYVSASLQYSDYTGEADFVVPYEMFGDSRDKRNARSKYLSGCARDMANYQYLIEKCGMSNDTAGYASPQGLRNILIMQGNNESWSHFIRTRACNRNTAETQYVTLKIWEELIKTVDGEELFHWAGPDCVHGKCREGKFHCENPMDNNPTETINELYPNITEV